MHGCTGVWGCGLPPVAGAAGASWMDRRAQEGRWRAKEAGGEGAARESGWAGCPAHSHTQRNGHQRAGTSQDERRSVRVGRPGAQEGAEHEAHRVQPAVGVSVVVRPAERGCHGRRVRRPAHGVQAHPRVDHRDPAACRRGDLQLGHGARAVAALHDRDAGHVEARRRPRRVDPAPGGGGQRVLRVPVRARGLGARRGRPLLLLRHQPHVAAAGQPDHRPAHPRVAPLQRLHCALPAGHLLRVLHDLLRRGRRCRQRRRLLCRLRPLPLPHPCALRPGDGRPFFPHAQAAREVQRSAQTGASEKDAVIFFHGRCRHGMHGRSVL